MSDASTPMAAPAPAPVLRLKVLSFVVAGLAVLTVILGLGVGFGRARMTPLALGLIGPFLCVILAFQVQAHKDWARIWLAVLALLGTLGDVRDLPSLWGWWERPSWIYGSLRIYDNAAFVSTLLSAVLSVLIIIQALIPRTIAWCQPLAARALADKYAQPLAQQYPAQQYPPSGAVPPQAAAQQPLEPQFG